MTLGDAYCAALRPKPVDEVTTADLLTVLQPIWQAKPETASRIRGRIEAVLDAARVQELIPAHEATPARWRGQHAALVYEDVPAFVARLREREAMAALALELAILTACRTGEALGAEWAEINLAKKLWTIPASRMKAGREHRVPLCERAAAILERLASAQVDDQFVFPGQRRGKPLSNMAMAMLLRRMGVDDAIIEAICEAWNNLIKMPQTIKSIGMREWAHVGPSE